LGEGGLKGGEKENLGDHFIILVQNFCYEMTL
jgi:hypothetical protein